MLTTEQINDLHRLYWSDDWAIREIERHLHMGWDTIKKYLDMPAQTPEGRPRSGKLDPYKATIAELLEKDLSASAAVIGQRLPTFATGSRAAFACLALSPSDDPIVKIGNSAGVLYRH